jgi:hypothetical protein
MARNLIAAKAIRNILPSHAPGLSFDGHPQWGHASAFVEIWAPHSLQGVRAMHGF